MDNYAKTLLALFAAATFVAPATASTSNMFRLEVPVMSAAPVIDGKISEEELSQTVEASLLLINSREKPDNATTVHVGATRQGLYVAFRAQESNLGGLDPDHTESSGAVTAGDSVQVLLTPTPEVTVDQYYHFAVNPYNVTYGRHIQSGDVVRGWQAHSTIIESDTTAGAGRWEAEFFIPLKAINAPEGRPTWRGNFARHRPTKGENPAETSAWFNPGISLFNYKRFGFLGMPNFVTGSAGEASARPNAGSNGTTDTPTLTTVTGTGASTEGTTAAAASTTDIMPVSVPVPESPQRR